MMQSCVQVQLHKFMATMMTIQAQDRLRYLLYRRTAITAILQTLPRGCGRTSQWHYDEWRVPLLSRA
jgi:hypothetical protein